MTSELTRRTGRESGAGPEVTGTANHYSENEISLDDIWHRVLDAKLVVLACGLAAALGGFIAAMLMAPVYRAEVLLAPVNADSGGAGISLGGQLGGLASLAGINIGGGSRSRDEAVALLKSRVLIAEFVDANSLLPVLFSDQWDSDTKRWIDEDPDGAPTRWDAINLFTNDILSVSENPRNGLVTLAVEWGDPVVAAAWAKGLVDKVNMERRARAIRDAESSLRFLNEYLQKTNVVSVQQAVNSLIEAQTKQMMLASVQEDYAFRTIDPVFPPDRDDPVSPNKLWLTVIGALFGGLVGIIWAVLRDPSTTSRRQPEV